MIGASTTPQISILIVAYNSEDLIADCLSALPDACGGITHEVLLIDNGDGRTEQLVSKQFPQVRIIASQGNVGFARGNNMLAQHARAPLLLLLNPDMLPLPASIEALAEGADRHQSAVAWGAVSLSPDGSPDSGNSIAVPSLSEFVSVALGRSIEGSRAIRGLDSDEQVATLSGSFVLIDKDAWDAKGGLDESYFLYCEEVDLFHRLSKDGSAFWRIARARGRHTSGHGRAASPVRLLYKTSGTVQFLRLHWTAPARWLGILLIWIAAIERALAGALLGRWNERIKSTGHAYRLVALRPDLWMSGYCKNRGLLTRVSGAGDL